jgi:hypothetical protein
MTCWFRSFLFSKQFFGLLFLVAVLNLVTDLTEHIHPRYWQTLNGISIGVDCVLIVLAGWIFLDLQMRKPK